MEKKKVIFLFLAVLLFAGFASADSITSYKVPATMPLNQGITATGSFNSDTNILANVLCSFYFFDTSGNLVNRATDQYTDSAGRFALPKFILTEPDFQRGKTFTLRTTCNGASADGNFLVEQKQDVVPFIYPQGLANDIRFFADQENSALIVFILMLVVVVIGVALYVRKGLTH